MGWVVNVTPGPLYPQEKTRYPLYRRLGGPQGRCGQVLKMPPPPRFDPQTVQPVASRYTDRAIPAHAIDPKIPKTHFVGFSPKMIPWRIETFGGKL